MFWKATMTKMSPLVSFFILSCSINANYYILYLGIVNDFKVQGGLGKVVTMETDLNDARCNFDYDNCCSFLFYCSHGTFCM